MTEAQALALKDIFFRIKQFYYGVSDKPLSAANLTAGESMEYISVLNQAEKELFSTEKDDKNTLPADAVSRLLTLVRATRDALKEKNVRLSGDLSALGIRLLGVYTFPYMPKKRFLSHCLLPFRERHGEDWFCDWDDALLREKNTPFSLRPAFREGEWGYYYDDDADEAFSVAHPVLYRVFVLLGVLLLLGSVVGFGLLSGALLSLSSPWLILGYLGAAAFGMGIYSVLMAWVHQYMGNALTLTLTLSGMLAMLLSVVLA